MTPFPITLAGRVGTVIGFLAMALLGWKVADRPQAASSVVREQADDAGKAAKRPDRANRRGGAPEAVRRQVAGLRAITSPGDRMRATIELANALPTSEIAAWLDGRWFDTGRGFDVTLFNKILKERWAKEDPEGLVLWGLKNNTSQASATLAKWADTDPQRMLAFFKEHPNRDLELQTLTAVAKKNPAVALQALQEMKPGDSRNGMSGYYIGQLLRELAGKSPAELERALASLPASVQTSAEAALIGQKLKTSFTTEIEKLWARPDGWRIFETALNHDSDGMGDQIFNHLANMPAGWRASIASDAYSVIGDSDPAKWCRLDLQGMGFTAEQAGSIHSMALTKFGYKNPEAALKLMAEMDLGDNARSAVLSNVFGNFRGGPEKAEALLALLGSETDKQAALGAMGRNSNATASKVETPGDWLEKVSATDPNGGGIYQELLMLRNWDQEKINDLCSKFQSMPDDKKWKIATIVARNSGYADNIKPLQADAIRYLIANPTDPQDGRQSQFRTTHAVSEFAVRWLQSDPAAAGDWVRSLPAGEARQWAQKNLAANWAQYDPEATEQWINTLPSDDRVQVQEFIERARPDR